MSSNKLANSHSTRGTRGTRARNTLPHSRNAGCTALSAWVRTMYTVRSLTGCARGQPRRETRGSTGGTDCRVSNPALITPGQLSRLGVEVGEKVGASKAWGQ